MRESEMFVTADEKLIAKEGNIYTDDGRFICSISMTSRATQLLNDDEWDRGKESWLDYRQRTKPEREAEEQKRIRFAEDIAALYNKFYKEVPLYNEDYKPQP